MKKNLLLFLITLSANLHAVEYTVNWQKQFSEGNYYRDGEHLAYPSIDQNGVMYLTIDGRVSALNTENGEIIWTNHDINASDHWYSGGASGPHYPSSSQPLVLGRDGCLYTIARTFSQTDEYYSTAKFSTYLVVLNKINGGIIDKILISSLIQSWNNSLGFLNYHNNHILLGHKQYFSFTGGKLKYLRNLTDPGWSNDANFLGFTDNLALFSSIGHIFAKYRNSGQIAWVNHYFGGSILYSYIDESGNFYYIVGNALHSIKAESGDYNYILDISSSNEFLELDSIVDGEETRGFLSHKFIDSNSEHIILQTENKAGDSYKSFILVIDKIEGKLLNKIRSDHAIKSYNIIGNDITEVITWENGLYFYENNNQIDSNYYSSLELNGTSIRSGKNIFLINDTNMTSLTIGALSDSDLHISSYYNYEHDYPDNSLAFDNNSSSSIDDDSTIHLIKHTPQNTNSSNGGNNSYGSDVSNGGSSDYSSDPNYIEDFIATNALDYGYAPLVELTSTGATPHTNGWYYQPTWGWMWTSESIFPYVYRSDTEGKTAGWMYFKEGSGSPIYFYSYSDQKWTLLEESTD